MDPPHTPPQTQNREPVTPKNRVGAVAASEKLQSTPSNAGTASVAEHLNSILVKDISPSLMTDIKDHDTCSFSKLLECFLKSCLSDEFHENPPNGLLNTCLEAVLPLCNETGEPGSGKGKAKVGSIVDASALRTHLTLYGEQPSEAARYGHFVLACNHALHMLSTVEGLPLRDVESDGGILFHRNDPRTLRATHNDMQGVRKPDVIVCNLQSAHSASGLKQSRRWDKVAMSTAKNAPTNNFIWSDLHSMVEFKFKSNKLRVPPSTYVINILEPFLPESFPSDVYPISDDLPPADEPVNATNETSSLSNSLLPHSDVYRTSNDPSLTVEPLNPVKDTSSTSKSESTRHSVRLIFTPSANSTGSQPLGSSSSRKRKLEENKVGPTKKQKSGTDISKKMEAMLQSALYAAERRSHAPWISHTINLVIKDDILWVWWYDAEGAIQSEGINFIQDLPYFLVLLLCFQRFNLKNWGNITEFTAPSNPGGPYTFSVPRQDHPNSPATELNIDPEMSKLRFGLLGRVTAMLRATSQSPDPRDASQTLEGKPLVAKVSWPEMSRIPEHDIIAEAKKIGKEDPRVRGHIPEVICWNDFEEYSTLKIREALGIKSRGPRVLRTLVLPRLYPITRLIGEEFWNAFWECFLCHLGLWLHGVEHSDISVNNMMYDPRAEKPVGVLIDYDLAFAHALSNSRPSGTERTGTMPFMALELLSDDGWAGKYPRIYRYDWESFLWTLLWVCGRFLAGREIPKPPFDSWITTDYNICFEKKFAVENIIKRNRISPTPSYDLYWASAIQLIYSPVDLIIKKNRNFDLPEPGIEELVKVCYDTCERLRQKIPVAWSCDTCRETKHFPCAHPLPRLMINHASQSH